ncbi:MAG: hypothetical protein GY950_16115 [bacterium]|nr:hypothetical protein [bacterium]
MKKQKEKKLQLNKLTIKNLDADLDRDEQKKIKGGTGNDPQPNTVIPVYC